MTVRTIDTKGIDRNAARQDIEIHLDEPHTLAVLCSYFNNAPGAEARPLLERAKEAGVRRLQVNVALMVLPRPGEALAMKDDATSTPVETVEEGYELKAEQVELALEPLGLQKLAIHFYNATSRSPCRKGPIIMPSKVAVPRRRKALACDIDQPTRHNPELGIAPGH